MLEKILITGRVNHRKVFVVGKHDDSNKSGIIIRWLSKVKLWFNQVDIGYVGTRLSWNYKRETKVMISW